MPGTRLPGQNPTKDRVKNRRNLSDPKSHSEAEGIRCTAYYSGMKLLASRVVVSTFSMRINSILARGRRCRRREWEEPSCLRARMTEYLLRPEGRCRRTWRTSSGRSKSKWLVWFLSVCDQKTYSTTSSSSGCDSTLGMCLEMSIEIASRMKRKEESGEEGERVEKRSRNTNEFGLMASAIAAKRENRSIISIYLGVGNILFGKSHRTSYIRLHKLRREYVHFS